MRAATAFSLVVLTLLSCRGDFDERTGVYRAHRVKVTFPAGWDEIPGRGYSVLARKNPASSAQLVLSIQDLDESMTLDQYVALVNPLRTSIGITEVDSGTIHVNGVRGVWSVFDQQSQAPLTRSVMYTFVESGRLYVVTGTTSGREFDAWDEQFEQTVRTLEFEQTK